MDIPRGKAHKRRKMLVRIVYSIFGLGIVGGLVYYLSNLEPAAPTVERSTLFLGEVRKGPLVRKVRGTGALVPEDELYVPALSSGRIERIRVKPGVEVTPETVILEMSNPELQRDSLDAKLRLKGLAATYRNLEVQLENQLLSQKSTAEGVGSRFRQARIRADSEKELFDEGLVSNLTYQVSKIDAETLEQQYELEKQKLESFRESMDAQLNAQKAEMENAEARVSFFEQQLKALTVRAGISGVLQEVPVEEGQQVAPGTNLARVVRPDNLMAELQINETQANEIQAGQRAQIDTRNGVIPGTVTRIDPAASAGIVRVDVALEGELPRGARPQLTVDGTVEVERFDEVLTVQRPVYGRANSTISVFKILEDGETAVRTTVQLGKSSVNEIVVLAGLSEGDEIILSDTSNYDSFDRIRLIN